MTDWMIWLPVAGYFLTWLLIPWVLLRPKAHPSSAVAWIMVIIFMPFAGALLCGIFGGAHWKVRERKQEASSQLDRRLPDRDGVEENSRDPWRQHSVHGIRIRNASRGAQRPRRGKLMGPNFRELLPVLARGGVLRGFLKPLL